MKIGQVELLGPNTEILVIPRNEGDIVIKAQTVKNFKEFESLVPIPEAPGMRTKKGFKKDLKDDNFKVQTQLYDDMKFAYMIIKSIEPSDIDWEKTSLSDPSTWIQWDKELQEAGLSEVETNKIVVLALAANSLDEKKLQEARESFLLGLEQEESSISGHLTEQATT